MRKIFLLMHRPTFLSATADPVVSAFDTAEDANEALERKKRTLRKPFVKEIDLVDPERWKREKAPLANSSSDGLVDEGGSYYSNKYPSGSFGPGTARGRGEGYR